MSSSPLEDAIYEIWANEYNSADLSRIMMFIDEDLEALIPSSADPKTISPYLHAIFARGSPAVHSCVLKIICSLELAAPSSIIADFNFDILITRSLEAPPPEVASKIDEEKSAAFKAVILLLRLRKSLPESVIRSLVALYSQPKAIYKGCLLSFLCQTALLAPDQIALVPEAWHILVDNLAETGNLGIAQLILYSVESNGSYVYQTGFLSHLLSSLLNLSPEKGDAARQQSSIRLITDLLLTWPGLIWFGLRAGLLRDLLRLLPRHPDLILGVLKKVLNFNAPPSLIDGYVGFALAGLLPLGLVPALSEVALTHNATADFLASLLPYIPAQSAQYSIAPRPIARQSGLVAAPPVLVYQLAHSVGAEGSISSVAQFTFPQEVDSCNWMVIRRLLTIVLPNDPVELNAPTCKHFFQRLLDYFGSLPTLDHLREDCLSALVRLLIETEGLTGLLEGNAGFRHIIESVAPEIASAKTASWPYIRCIGILLCSARGCALLTKWRLTDTFAKLGESCKLPAMVPEIFSFFMVPKLTPLASSCIFGFLRHGKPEVFAEVLPQILKMLPVVEDFAKEVFEPAILKYLKAEFPARGNPRRDGFILFLTDVLSSDRPSLALAAEDPECHVLLRENTRQLHALLFSQCAKSTAQFLADEIAWWMETGNTEYVAAYHAAVQAVHNDASARVPPHLFGQLAHLEEGRAAARPLVPALVAALAQPAKQQGALFALAQFASDRATHEILDRATFAAMIKVWRNSSYQTKGTLIAAFAVIAPSRTFKNILAGSNWQLFTFGERSAAFPFSLDDLPPEAVYQPPNPVDDAPDDKARGWVRQLSSSITATKAKAGLDGLDEAAKTELAPFAFKYISHFFVPADGRDHLLRALASVSALRVKKRKVADAKGGALMAARLFVALKGKSNEPLTKMPIPTIAIGAIEEGNVALRAPEAFITDDEFAKWAGMPKTAFWALGEKKIRKARKALLGHQAFTQ